jgi:hypothetical protein
VAASFLFRRIIGDLLLSTAHLIHNSSQTKTKSTFTAKIYIETTNKANSKMAEVLVAEKAIEYALSFAKVAAVSAAKRLVRKKVRCVGLMKSDES